MRLSYKFACILFKEYKVFDTVLILNEIKQRALIKKIKTLVKIFKFNSFKNHLISVKEYVYKIKKRIFKLTMYATSLYCMLHNFLLYEFENLTDTKHKFHRVNNICCTSASKFDVAS